MVRIFSIDGNIGSGKSTFVQKLNEFYSKKKNCSGKKICFLQEPVDEWNTITDEDGKTMIECYYADPDKYSFSFQMMAYISRLALIRAELKKDYDIIFTERSIFTDKNVFAKMLYDDGKINEIEYKIYNKWFDEFIDDFPTIEYIYMRTSPQTAFDRIIKRGRPGETISLEYLQKCHDYHESWLSPHEKHVIECDVNIEFNPTIMNDWINSVDALTHLYSLTFDGASRGNPGLCGAGYVIWLNKEVFHTGKKFISEKDTNNVAEYSAVIAGLEKCIELNIKNINVMGDSQLVIKQVNHEYKLKTPHLEVLYNTVIEMLTDFNNFKFNYIPRIKNAEADKLANEAINDYLLEKELATIC